MVPQSARLQRGGQIALAAASDGAAQTRLPVVFTSSFSRRSRRAALGCCCVLDVRIQAATGRETKITWRPWMARDSEAEDRDGFR